MIALNSQYFPTQDQARAEANRRRAQGRQDGLVTRVEPSPYGGWWVYCVPIDLLIDSMDFYFAPSHRNRATLLRRTL